MKKGLTSITIILDRSGSMASVRDDTIGAFNTLLADQKAAPGEAVLSLVQFDYQYEPMYSLVPIQQVEPLTHATFAPRGSTALLDAMGRTINDLIEQIAKLKDDETPEKVLVVVMTDGQENSSVEYTKPYIAELVARQREMRGWEFAFIGANMDAISEARSMGMSMSNAVQYESSKDGTRKAVDVISAGLRNYRGRDGSRQEAIFTNDDGTTGTGKEKE